MQVDLYKQVSCVILSAGSSRRMGCHKALLPYDKDRNFVQKITSVYLEAGIEQIIVVVNEELLKLISGNQIALSEKVQLVVNESPDLGRFFSLQTGVKLIPRDNYCFFQNIDNLHSNLSLLHQLMLYTGDADVIKPVFDKQAGHPVLFNKRVTSRICSAEGSDIRIDAFLKQFKCKKIHVSDPGIRMNINTPEDYLKAGFSKF